MAKKRSSIPTVREIAAHCGVSNATVSRVLNGNYSNGFSVREEVRQLITQMAEELGYRPNLAAKNLVKRQTKIIGIIGYNTVFGWPTNIYQLTTEEAVRLLQAHQFDICATAPNLLRDDTELPPWRVDGIIVTQECSPRTIEEMEKTSLPYVVINGPCGPRGCSVVPDDIEATRQAIQYLYGLGHRRIAYAGPTPEHRRHMSIEERYSTYTAELKRLGLKAIEEGEKPFSNPQDFLARAVLEEKATAILAYDHVVALKILHDAPVCGIQIPEQVSLMCFNDEYLCDIVKPALTTMGAPSREMGKLAAQLLLKQIQQPAEERVGQTIKLRQHLIIRASAIPPNGRKGPEETALPEGRVSGYDREVLADKNAEGLSHAINSREDNRKTGVREEN
ncbi:MAG TPA: LacI family DNA-binding transcriptional regulator [Anaerohalosphaeraceae bacterium]|mgnify:CR=1 FL=1|nr:LacI family DNA-binding transcriptional regulator [Anaerohalosphaeraceae bacterium]HPB93610.1 LacI family DNA-binding transcriptional regulator [Anaerohalosphaeraceae bacterium]